MYRNGYLYRKIIRKLFAVVIFLIGLRLVWVSLVSGWTSDVSGMDLGKTRDLSNGEKNLMRFVNQRGNIGGNSEKFEFARNADKRHSSDIGKSKHKASETRAETNATVKNNSQGSGYVNKKNENNVPDYMIPRPGKPKEPNDIKENQARPIKNETSHKEDGKIQQNQIKAIVKPGMNVIDRKVIEVPLNKTTDTKTDIMTSKLIQGSLKALQVEKAKVENVAEVNAKKPKDIIFKYNNQGKVNVEGGKTVANSTKLIGENYKDKATEISGKAALKYNGKEKEWKEKEKKGVCKIVDRWGQKDKKIVSTYDLFQNVSYKMNSDGSYPIPVRSHKEIVASGELKQLTVILVPFSHADPGYGLTIEQYYEQMTHNTLTNMIAKLEQYPNMTFQWAETVYLARWFEDLDESGKSKVKELIRRGQFEIVLGGWVMPDEASPNYVAVVDQLIEGHQWLLENLGVIPKSAWVNDPFGYSSTMPYLWKSSGMDNLLFLRINQPVKARLMKTKSLDFMWRPYWKYSNESDVLSTLMPYTNYWVSDVLGPEQRSCQEFNFLHMRDGNSKAVEVTDLNVAVQARKLSEQFRITGDLYKYNTLYIGLGEDFSYPHAEQWDSMYRNYQKLSNFINNQASWNMKVKFGTLTEYFTNVRDEEQKMRNSTDLSQNNESTFPTLSGDFFPYTERNREFWTGYFTTRPLNKRFSREIESLVRAADIFHVVGYSLFKYYGVKYAADGAVAEALRKARRELGMFMHHDGITGTSLPHVVQDFENRLFNANVNAHTALKMAVLSLLSKGKQHNPKFLQEEIMKPGTKNMAGKIVIDTNKEAQLIMINSVERKRKEVFNVFVNAKDIEIASPNRKNVPYQVTVPKENTDNTPFIISFEAELPALGVEQYTLKPKHRPAERTVAIEESPIGDVIMIENTFMRIEFEKDTGFMKRIVDKNGHVTNITAQFMVYKSQTSGAYIFGPAGPAKAFLTASKNVRVIKGQLFSEVKVTSLGFMFSVRLYNTSGIQGQGIHVRTEVEMPAVNMNEMEVILRFQTDVESGDLFYTDQNGFQLLGRQNRHGDPIESNYYPVTTMAVLEDSSKRFTLHCKQPHGGASLKPGRFEVMLDRHTFRDDKRGLGQGVYDNVRVNSDFIVQIEHKTSSYKPEEVRYTYPSEDSILMNDFLQNNVLNYIQQDTSLSLLQKVHPLKTFEFPCDVSIVGLRNIVKNNLDYNATSLVLHRKPVHCGYTSKNNQCPDKFQPLTIRNIFPKLKVQISETSLSHLHNKKDIGLKSDITPAIHELRAYKIKL